VATSKESVDPSVSPPNIQSNCQTVTGLAFCTDVNGNRVIVTDGDTPTQIDDTVKSTFEETIANPLVFSTPNATGCAEAFKHYLCSSAFPLCDDVTACQADCKAAITKCTIQEGHAGLYDCTQGSATTCLTAKDDTESAASFGTISLVLMVLSVLLFL